MHRNFSRPVSRRFDAQIYLESRPAPAARTMEEMLFW